MTLDATCKSGTVASEPVVNTELECQAECSKKKPWILKNTNPSAEASYAGVDYCYGYTFMRTDTTKKCTLLATAQVTCNDQGSLDKTNCAIRKKTTYG